MYNVVKTIDKYIQWTNNCTLGIYELNAIWIVFSLLPCATVPFCLFLFFSFNGAKKLIRIIFRYSLFFPIHMQRKLIWFFFRFVCKTQWVHKNNNKKSNVKSFSCIFKQWNCRIGKTSACASKYSEIFWTWATGTQNNKVLNLIKFHEIHSYMDKWRSVADAH